MTRTCIVDACEAKHYGHGYCAKHWARWRRHGDPSVTVPFRRRFYESAASRIARQVKPAGDCLVFTGGQSSRSGHRKIGYKGAQRGVHRVAFELANGPVPEGLVVMHRCDNPPCVNLDHLRLGTVADNNADRDRKGRHRPLPGSKNGQAKLTEWQAAEIRVHLARGVSQYALADRYGVHQGLIWLIKVRRSWKHVEPATWAVAEFHANPIGAVA